jgi:hypothetical protein
MDKPDRQAGASRDVHKPRRELITNLLHRNRCGERGGIFMRPRASNLHQRMVTAAWLISENVN